MGSEHLCKSCNCGQVIAGYRESDLLVICMNTSPNIVVPFTVFDCSEFSDKFKPTWEQMTKLALHLNPVRVSAKTRGFGTVTTIRVEEDEEEAENVG